MDTLVLVHAAWHDGSSWGNVIKRLEHHGRNAFAPTKGRRGEGCHTHGELCQPTVDFIIEGNLTDVVLVGHSYGGTVISKVVERVPERIR